MSTKPRTLYICRPVLNADDIDDWAKRVGFTERVPIADMHVTVAFSKRPLAWPAALKAGVIVPPPHGEKREVKSLGDEGAVVLAFDATELYRRWRALLDIGATWDYATYQPHVTVSYAAPKGVDFDKVEPFDGAIELGPEKLAEIDPNWATNARTT